MDQFMVGHGFTSEIAQNKSMAASFDNGSSNENSKSQSSPHSLVSSSAAAATSNNSSNTNENSLGKKVSCLNIYFLDAFVFIDCAVSNELVHFLDVNFGRQRTNYA
jgi:hypothetical protein